jgi:hypothetical protein
MLLITVEEEVIWWSSINLKFIYGMFNFIKCYLNEKEMFTFQSQLTIILTLRSWKVTKPVSLCPDSINSYKHQVTVKTKLKANLLTQLTLMYSCYCCKLACWATSMVTVILILSVSRTANVMQQSCVFNPVVKCWVILWWNETVLYT